MIQIRPTVPTGEERRDGAEPRRTINIVYAGSGPATFLSSGLAYELEPDILLPPVTHLQGLWVVPAAEFPASLPAQRAPGALNPPRGADLLDVPEPPLWPSEEPSERLLRYGQTADELVLLTTPEYEAGWRERIGGVVAIAVLRGLPMPDGAVADARIEVPSDAADRLAELPAVLAELAGRDTWEADAEQVDLLDTAQPLLQEKAAESVAAGKPQAAQDAISGTMGGEAAATPARASQSQPDAPGEVQDVPTAKLRAQLAQREAAKAAKVKADEAASAAPAEPVKRTPPAAPRLSAAIPPRAPKAQVRLAEENKNPWERTEGGALNAVTHHARCEAHPVERKSDVGGVRFRAAPKCRILAEVAQPDGEADDGVLLG